MAGQLVLDQRVEVRILRGQQKEDKVPTLEWGLVLKTR